MIGFFDLIEGRDDQLTYDSVRQVLEDINEETQRLEFKRVLDLKVMTKSVVAMANAIGGIVVVGFEDPSAPSPLRVHVNNEVFDDRARRRLMSRIQAQVYPSLTLTMSSLRSGDEKHSILIVRVPQSPLAPHELLDQRGRFPVRRGAQVEYLGLQELEQLISRRDNVSNDRRQPLFVAYPHISTDMNNEDRFVSVGLSPELGSPVGVLTGSVQESIADIVQRMPGLQETTVTTQADGVLFVQDSVDVDIVTNDRATVERHRRRCYVGSDGQVVVRLPQDSNNIVYQFMRVFASSYAISAKILQILGVGPRVRVVLAYKIDSKKSQPSELFVSSFEYTKQADMSRDLLADMASEGLLYAMRAASNVGEMDDFAEKLSKIWRDEYARNAEDLDPRNSWR